MAFPPSRVDSTGPSPTRSYGLPMTEYLGVPHDDARDITTEMIREVVVEFYKRARLDEQLGPVFDHYIQDWDFHLDRMTDFWSAALLRSGRYSGRPVERHRGIEGLSGAHFRRWVELFEVVTRDVCPPQQAEAFMVRARKMREGMTKVLGLEA